MRSPNADCNKIEMVNYTDLIIFAGKRVILDNFSFLKKVARVMENAILWGWLENNPTNQINAQIASFSSPQPPSHGGQLGSFEKSK